MSLVLYFQAKKRQRRPSQVDSRLIPGDPRTLAILMVRGVIAGSNIFIFYSALKFVSLSTFLVLRNVKGIFVLMMTPVFLDERLSWFQVFLILVSFVGTAMVVNPHMFLRFFDMVSGSRQVLFAQSV